MLRLIPEAFEGPQHVRQHFREVLGNQARPERLGRLAVHPYRGACPEKAGHALGEKRRDRRLRRPQWVIGDGQERACSASSARKGVVIALMQRNAPSAVEYLNLPADRVIELGARISI